MANFSDDEQFSVVDSILQQRKRKGVLEYLVKWKDGPGVVSAETWEPAGRFKADCPGAVTTFEKFLKNRSKRSSSRSRKSSQSRSRSRSSSRTRKPRQSTRTKTTRSQSRGKSSESRGEKAEAAKALGDSVDAGKPEKSSEAPASGTKKEQGTAAERKETMMEKKVEASETNSGSSRVLRSSTVAGSAKSRTELEVQRVHNEQRPVREDDKTPRSAIWKVADYFVIVLFVISALAALVLFIEKFVDLENFKKQAFPSLTVLQGRLVYARDRLADMASAGADKVTDLWLQVVEQIRGSPSTPASATPKQ